MQQTAIKAFIVKDLTIRGKCKDIYIETLLNHIYVEGLNLLQTQISGPDFSAYIKVEIYKDSVDQIYSKCEKLKQLCYQSNIDISLGKGCTYTF